MATVQFNLIPDIKYEYLKAKRLERTIVSATVVAVIICVVLLAALIFEADFRQKHNLSNLSSEITTSSQKVKSINGLDKIITIQNQLESLPALYEQDPSSSRIFNYISQLTPPEVTVGDLTLNLTAGSAGTSSGGTPDTMEIQGQAPTLSNVNAYTDALKEATYSDKTAGTSNVPAFSDVVLSSFSMGNQGATYTINLNFDPTLFKTDDTIALSVPKKTNLPEVPGLNGQIFKALPQTNPSSSIDNPGASTSVSGSGGGH